MRLMLTISILREAWLPWAQRSYMTCPGSSIRAGREPRFSYSQSHLLSTWLLHFLACPAIAAAFSTCYVLDSVFIFWQHGTSQKTGDTIIADPDLLYPKNGVLALFVCFGEHFIRSLITSITERKRRGVGVGEGQRKVYWLGKETKFIIHTEINPSL